jgi:hypothetical protein
MQKDPAALNRIAPGDQHRLALATWSKSLGNAIHEQIDDLVVAQVPLGEGLVVLP